MDNVDYSILQVQLARSFARARYRVVYNGLKYRIQRKGLLWGWNWVKGGYDGAWILEFRTKEEACEEMEKKIGNHVTYILSGKKDFYQVGCK
jgi:hypothetical protein